MADSLLCPADPEVPCPQVLSRRGSDPRLDSLCERVGTLETKMEANTALTQEVKRDTAAIVEAWTALSGGLKVLGVLGTIGKYVAYIAAAVSAVSALWAVITHWGEIPKVPK